MEPGNRFKSIKTGEIFTIAEINEKFNQIIIAGEDGKTKAYSATTLKDKRIFLPLENDDTYVAEVMQQKKDLGIECPKIESYEVEVLTEAGTIKKVKKAETPKTGVGTDIKDYVVATAKKLGVDICESNGRFISFKVNNKMFAAIFSYSKKSLTLGVRSKSIEGKTNPDSTTNHMMDARFKFDTLTDNVKELIRLILESAFEYQSNLKK